MRLRTLIVLLLAVICGGSAAMGVVMMKSRMRPIDAETISVVVATREIPRGQMIVEEMVAIQQRAVDHLPPTALGELEAVVGRTALSPIMKGEPVLNARLADRQAGRGLAALIPEGKRAYTIQTSRVASNVAGFVMPGNRVDVLLTLRGGSDDETGGGSSTTLLQAVEILAVDERLVAPSENHVDPQQLRSVTLMVTPDQASLLDLGQNMGTLTLSLRNLEDMAEAKTEPATIHELRYTQREPVDKGPSILGRVTNAIAAAAAAAPRVEAMRPTIPEVDDEPQYQEIRTLRGRHAGRVLIRAHQTAATE